MASELITIGTVINTRIAAEWANLCDEGFGSGPFLRPDWFTIFARNFDISMELVTVRSGERLRALLPVAHARSTLHGLPVRILRGVFNLNTQRFDLVHGAREDERSEVIENVWTSLRERSDWDVIEFRLVRSDSWLVDVLSQAERAGYRTGLWQMDAAPYIDLSRPGGATDFIEDFFSGPRKHLRRELDRRIRRLHELGELKFIVTIGCSSEKLSTYFALEGGGWKGRAGTAVTDDARVEQLHREFAELLTEKENLVTYELTLDGKTIAMSLNIRDGEKLVHWKTSYDENFSRYAPGNILFRKLLTDCVEQDIKEIDFLSPSTQNKRVWATGEREHTALYIFRRGAIGSLIWVWKFGVVAWLRRLRDSALLGRARDK
jgi:Acetyltransferase (GNAT) domain